MITVFPVSCKYCAKIMFPLFVAYTGVPPLVAMSTALCHSVDPLEKVRYVPKLVETLYCASRGSTNSPFQSFCGVNTFFIGSAFSENSARAKSLSRVSSKVEGETVRYCSSNSLSVTFISLLQLSPSMLMVRT